MDNLTENIMVSTCFLAKETVPKVLTVRGRWCYWQRLKMALSRMVYLTNQMLLMIHIFFIYFWWISWIGFLTMHLWQNTTQSFFFLWWFFIRDIFLLSFLYFVYLVIWPLSYLLFLWLYQGAFLWKQLMFKC